MKMPRYRFFGGEFSKRESFCVGVVYFLILLCIALWVRDIPNQPDAFNLTIQQLIKTSSMGDPASFATAAIDIAENGWISSANNWIFNLWPPGFVLLEAFILKVMGPEVPVVLVLQILAALLFSVVLTLLYDFLRARVKNKVAFGLPLLIFAFPVSRVFLLEPTGITLGESFSIGFFLISILLAIRSVIMQSSLQYAVYAGFCLALSAYFRSQFELILLALTFWGIVLFIALLFTRLRKFVDPNLLKSSLKTIGVMLLAAHAATVPWRIYHWVNHGGPHWVYTSSVTFGNSVMTSEYLESVNGGFVVAGGGNLVCRIDPTTCGDKANAKQLFIKTFIENPVEWYSLKLDVIGEYWFSSVKNWSSVYAPSTWLDVVTNGILLISLIILVALLFTRKVMSHASWPLLLWFNASLFSTYLLIITVQQFEARYFYFPKIAGLTMLLILGPLYWRPTKSLSPVSTQ